ncbi:NAD(P)H-binding protein [Flavobacterium sp. 123]|uniref:NAD(P)H-binding protein n=1 Tax=Flavobacterium sp. 123 TaxID=2135627 RepID=UPI000EAC4CC4|nr:NAD(P)H-binding protein [Flavobacterium sp. 123]RKS99333.1 nucleoside-diphosphate-sugar epimerase [Flavobacterium sp. 123]
MTQISILGCGWLGLPLAKALLEKGFLINGSTTSEEKILTLKNKGINPFLIRLDSQNVVGEMDRFLKGSTTLIIDIPPKLRGNSTEDFVGKIQNLIPHLENSTLKNVLFISSTSVYGENNTIITEETTTNPDTEGGRQLVKAEALLQKNSHFKTTILRFGGLIGEDRNPVKFLSGRENIENPEAPINLIHQEDCIGIILKILETDSWNETFNAVTPFHPSREQYYTQKATDLNLVPPKFNTKNASKGKTVLSYKIESVLKYTFAKTNL